MESDTSHKIDYWTDDAESPLATLVSAAFGAFLLARSLTGQIVRKALLEAELDRSNAVSKVAIGTLHDLKVPFSIFSGTYKSNKPLGFGFGLQLAKFKIESWGGLLKVESSPTGTLVSIFLASDNHHLEAVKEREIETLVY